MTTANVNPIKENRHENKMSDEELNRLFETAKNKANEDIDESYQLFNSLCEIQQMLKKMDDNNMLDNDTVQLTACLDVITTGLSSSLGDVQSSLQRLHTISLKWEWDNKHAKQSG